MARDLMINRLQHHLLTSLTNSLKTPLNLSKTKTPEEEKNMESIALSPCS
jgi:hypothetical protein